MEPRETFAAYLVRRLARAKYADLEAEVLSAHQALSAKMTAVTAVEWTVQAAVADRDIADDDLDLTARDALARLGGRNATATKTAPYIDVAPNGVKEYVDADLPDQLGKYSLFAERLEKHLGADDPLRGTAAVVRTQLVAWQACSKAVIEARNQRQLARDARDRAIVGWEEALTRVYGALIQRVGKAGAERFFPKNRKGRARVASEPSVDEAAVGAV